MPLARERFEIGHLLEPAAVHRILPALALRLLPCPDAGPGGFERVQTLYFGDAPGPGPESTPRRRLSLRLREVTGRPARCAVEVKHRVGFRSITSRAPLALEDATALAAGLGLTHGPPAAAEASDLVRAGLGPSVLVCHERIALVGDASEPDLRVTIDSALSFRTTDLRLRAGASAAGDPVLPEGHALLVVQVVSAVPHWFTLLLGRAGAAARCPGKHALATAAARALALPEATRSEG